MEKNKVAVKAERRGMTDSESMSGCSCRGRSGRSNCVT